MNSNTIRLSILSAQTSSTPAETNVRLTSCITAFPTFSVSPFANATLTVSITSFIK